MTETRVIQTSRDDHLVAGLAALAITIHIAESALPSPLPGIKPGLANVVTLLVLCHYGWRMAAWVSLLRVLVGSILIGTFLSPAFFLSASGAITSILVLGFLYALSSAKPSWTIGPLGLAVAGAMAHMTGQFWVAYALFIPHPGILALYPVLLSFAAILGIVSGILTRAVLTRLNNSSPYNKSYNDKS
ncbi:Gx transporter family protein [Kaarinaea lacus]